MPCFLELTACGLNGLASGKPVLVSRCFRDFRGLGTADNEAQDMLVEESARKHQDLCPRHASKKNQI